MNKLVINGLIVAAFALMIASCQYKFIVEPAPIPPDPEDTISFSLQIEPIFSEDGCTACHKTSGQKPDLTAGNAYNSLTTGGYIDAAAPELSKIYVVPASDGSHYKKYTSTQALLLLTWIQQGAKNN